MTFQVTSELVSKILNTVDAGLVKGLGEAQPGKMCIEAAVCYAMGLPHSDEPTCVGSAVREFKIIINDAKWSSDQARAAGMRKLAVAQLGSDTIDQEAFSEKVVFQTIKQILPEMFSDIAKQYPNQGKKFLFYAEACSKAVDLEEAKAAANAASAAADAADAAAADAADAVAASAADAAAAAASAAVAAVFAAMATKTGDKYLIISAEIALQVLKDLKSPGCEFLYMCN